MPDVFPKRKRSEIMAANRGKGNKSTELKLQKLLEDAGITAWRKNPSDIYGKPDFVFDEKKLAVFVDGCFWHGCPTCRNLIPETNAEFWLKKIQKTKERDIKVKASLVEEGWQVLRIWEHDLRKQPEQILDRILSYL